MLECVLDGLLAEEFLANACAFSTAPALRQFFVRQDEVRKVSEALVEGSLTEDAIQTFVARLLGDLKVGIHFHHDLTFAALAVAMAKQTSPFVEQFLRELAELRVAEIPLAPRVAQDVLQNRPARLESASQPLVPQS
jgi:hypothetical protein